MWIRYVYPKGGGAYLHRVPPAYLHRGGCIFAGRVGAFMQGVYLHTLDYLILFIKYKDLLIGRPKL